MRQTTAETRVNREEIPLRKSTTEIVENVWHIIYLSRVILFICSIFIRCFRTCVDIEMLENN